MGQEYYEAAVTAAPPPLPLGSSLAFPTVFLCPFSLSLGPKRGEERSTEDEKCRRGDDPHSLAPSPSFCGYMQRKSSSSDVYELQMNAVTSLKGERKGEEDHQRSMTIHFDSVMQP